MERVISKGNVWDKFFKPHSGSSVGPSAFSLLLLQSQEAKVNVFATNPEVSFLLT